MCHKYAQTLTINSSLLTQVMVQEALLEKAVPGPHFMQNFLRSCEAAVEDVEAVAAVEDAAVSEFEFDSSLLTSIEFIWSKNYINSKYLITEYSGDINSEHLWDMLRNKKTAFLITIFLF